MYVFFFFPLTTLAQRALSRLLVPLSSYITNQKATLPGNEWTAHIPIAHLAANSSASMVQPASRTPRTPYELICAGSDVGTVIERRMVSD